MPGSKCFFPSVSAFSKSIVPTRRSSVAETGRSTKGVARVMKGISEAVPYFEEHSSQRWAGSFGSQPKRQPWMTFCSGSSFAKARAAVDFAVPRSPMINTPPMRGSTAFKISARFIFSCPTMAVNGNKYRFMKCPSFLMNYTRFVPECTKGRQDSVYRNGDGYLGSRTGDAVQGDRAVVLNNVKCV